MTLTPGDIARAVGDAATLDDFAHGLLAILSDISHLDSVFVTRVDAGLQNCEIAYAHNTQLQRMRVQEGSVVPWSDSTCQNALAEGIRTVQRADEHWEHLQVVHDLNICTYAVEPIQNAGGRLLGTLCVTSARRLPVTEDTQDVMRVISRLLAGRMDAATPPGEITPAQRDALDRLQAQIARRVPAQAGLLDPLTGLPNRGALRAETDFLLAMAGRQRRGVAVTTIDLLGFEVIDEANGHAAADDFLAAVARRLAAARRDGEFLARLGDREFAVVAISHATGTALDAEVAERDARYGAATAGAYAIDWSPLDYRGAGVGTVLATEADSAERLLRRAVGAMVAARPVEPANLRAPQKPLPTPGPLGDADWY